MKNYKNFGLLKDTEENKKIIKEFKYFPCVDCGEQVSVEKTTSIIYSNTILMSGTHPPIGFINKIEWFGDARCERCENKWIKENDEYDEEYY